MRFANPTPDYPWNEAVSTVLLMSPITITIALMCCAFLIAVAYVVVDERV